MIPSASRIRGLGIEGYLRKHIELLQQQSKEQYISPYFIALDYAMLGEKDRAFEWLDKALQERSSWLVEVRVDPLWDLLRSDARYNQLLQRMVIDNPFRFMHVVSPEGRQR